MSRIKSAKPVRWERLLMVLANGGVITKSQIEHTMQYKAMYRIPTELWKLKNRGAVIKSYKDGRDVVGYELVNVKEMKTFLTQRGFDVLPLVDSPAVANLSDLKAEQVAVSEVSEQSEELV
jgi:hypothetical protein